MEVLILTYKIWKINTKKTGGKKLKKIKPVVGILLIVLSFLMFTTWEFKGRELLLYEDCLVANTDIKKGEIVSKNKIKTVAINKELLTEGFIKKENAEKIIGKVANAFIPQQAQIDERYFSKNNLRIKNGESIYVIHNNSIYMCSSSIRRGDLVNIYKENSGEDFGEYVVAYVKDKMDREVTDSNKNKEGDFLKRINSTSVVDHIEIIANFEDYKKIKEGFPADLISRENNERASYIIVQKN